MANNRGQPIPYVPAPAPTTGDQLNAIRATWDEFWRISGGFTNLYQRLRGGMRKNTTLALGTLNTTWRAVTGFNIDLFVPPILVVLDKTAGTLMLLKSASIVFDVGLQATFTSDNNSGRTVRVRLFNVTDNAVLPDAAFDLFIGAYQAGLTASVSLPREAAEAIVGKAVRIEVSCATTIANFTITNATLSTAEL